MKNINRVVGNVNSNILKIHAGDSTKMNTADIQSISGNDLKFII